MATLRSIFGHYIFVLWFLLCILNVCLKGRPYDGNVGDYRSHLMINRLKAKFHYASWFEAGSELVRSSFEAGSELKLVRSWFEAGSS